MSAWLAAYAFTQLVEVPIYVAATRGRSLAQRLAIAFGASAVTHPFVWFVWPELVRPYLLFVVVAEVFAIAVETAWLAAFDVKKPLAWALGANLVSVGLALVSRSLLGFP